MAKDNQSALNLLQLQLSRNNSENTNLFELNKIYENIKTQQQNYQKSLIIPIYNPANNTTNSNTNLASSVSSTASSISFNSLNKNFMNLSLHTNQQQQQQQQQQMVIQKPAQLTTSATFTAPLPIASPVNDSSKSVDRKKLFVGNLPSNTRLCELLDLFKKYGKVNEKLSVVKDQNYAFIHFYNENDAKIALGEVNDSLFKNRYIRVQYSTSQAHIKKSKTFDTAAGLSSRDSSTLLTNQQLKAKYIEEQLLQQQKQQQQQLQSSNNNLRAITGGNRCLLLQNTIQQQQQQQQDFQQQYLRQLLSMNNLSYLNSHQFNDRNNNISNSTANDSYLMFQQPSSLIGSSMIKSNTIASFQNNN